MQRDLKSIEDAGVQVVGISYDDTKVLKTASDRMKITFPLLSDPESKTIEAYHIRNEAAKGKAVGVPNPGTFILDQEGVIRAKLFLEGYRDRHTTEALDQGGEGRQVTPCSPNDEETDDAEAGPRPCDLWDIARLDLACLGRARMRRRSVRGTPTSLCRRSAIAHPSRLSNFRGKKVLLIQFASW